MTEHIKTEIAERVLTIRFNRADKKNALTQAMYTALAQAFKDAQANPEVRVILIAGQPDCFCSGNDIVDFLQLPPASTDSPVAQFMRGIAGCTKPVIAAPAGIAVGVGVTLLFQCDLVYCGNETKFNMPFVNLGICPELASSYLLPRFMGYQRAAELVLLGKSFTAQTALEYGMVNALVPNAEVEAEARKAALTIAALPPNAVRTTKALLRRWSQDKVMEAIEVEAQHFIPMLKQGEALEAMSAFMQKRKPDFSKFS